MYCDLLIARFGLIEKMKELDPGLDEAIATLLWASPRISTDIQEFKIIGDILGFKYGKKYAEACKTDALNNVNEKVKKRLGLEAPSKLLVEQYLIEIAKAHNVPFEPDQSVMLVSILLQKLFFLESNSATNKILWQKKNRELVTRTKSSSVWGRGQTS
jgi:vacuolar protein sorting-associated protein IST1